MRLVDDEVRQLVVLDQSRENVLERFRGALKQRSREFLATFGENNGHKVQPNTDEQVQTKSSDNNRITHWSEIEVSRNQTDRRASKS